MKIYKQRSFKFVAKQQGFTAVEAIIVVLVMGILCVLAVPQMIAGLRNNRVNTVNAIIVSKLAEARLQAIKRNSQCSFVVNTQTRRMWIEAGGVQIGGAELYPPEIEISYSPSTPLTQQKFTFNSFGYLSTTPTTITVRTIGQSFQRTVNVSLSGKISVGQTINITQ